MKTWMLIYCNAVLSLFPCKISQSVTWMSQSLLLETETTSWKHNEQEEMLFLERFPWARFEMEWNTDKCVSFIATLPQKSRIGSDYQSWYWHRNMGFFEFLRLFQKRSCGTVSIGTTFILSFTSTCSSSNSIIRTNFALLPLFVPEWNF